MACIQTFSVCFPKEWIWAVTVLALTVSWKRGLTVWWSQSQHAVFSWDFWILVQSWIRPNTLQLNTLLAINTQAPLQPTVTASSPELCLNYSLHPLTTWQQAWLSWNQWVRTWHCVTPHQRHTYSTVTSCLLYKHKDASASLCRASEWVWFFPVSYDAPMAGIKQLDPKCHRLKHVLEPNH